MLIIFILIGSLILVIGSFLIFDWRYNKKERPKIQLLGWEDICGETILHIAYKDNNSKFDNYEEYVTDTEKKMIKHFINRKTGEQHSKFTRLYQALAGFYKMRESFPEREKKSNGKQKKRISYTKAEINKIIDLATRIPISPDMFSEEDLNQIAKDADIPFDRLEEAKRMIKG